MAKHKDTFLRVDEMTRENINKRLERINDDLKRSGIKQKLSQKEFVNYLSKQPLILSVSELKKIPKRKRRII